MGNSRIDRIRQMSGDIRTGKGGRYKFSWGLALMVAAGLWAIVRFIIAVVYFF